MSSIDAATRPMLPPAPVDAFAIGITVGSIVLLMTTISCCIGCYYGRQRHKAMDLHRAVEAGMRSEVERLLKEVILSLKIKMPGRHRMTRQYF